MKIVHMADSHLGYSSYSRVDRNGRNAVEEMFYRGFDQAIDKIISLKPDAVVHAGDVFHHVRPKIRPLYIFKKGLERLADAGIPVIVISGNHDAPKSLHLTSPFVIFEGTPGLQMARKYAYERFDVGDTAFHCIPFCIDPKEYVQEFSKIKRTGKDVLVMHGLVESLRHRKLGTVGEHELNDSLLKSDFDYIALGHFHSQAKISSNAWYSGSVEYFTFGEAQDEKGILLVDLDRAGGERGWVTQVPVRERYMIDRPPVDCSGLSTEEISERLMEMCDHEEILDRIVRINLKNVNRAAYKNINQANINRLIAPAMHLKIRVEFADEEARTGERIDGLNLHEEFVKFAEGEAARGLLPGAIKDEVIAYGSDLVKKAVSSRKTEAMNAPE